MPLKSFDVVGKRIDFMLEALSSALPPSAKMHMARVILKHVIYC